MCLLVLYGFSAFVLVRAGESVMQLHCNFNCCLSSYCSIWFAVVIVAVCRNMLLPHFCYTFGYLILYIYVFRTILMDIHIPYSDCLRVSGYRSTRCFTWHKWQTMVVICSFVWITNSWNNFLTIFLSFRKFPTPSPPLLLFGRVSMGVCGM